eukprot:CAMPEP_0117682112 /NCGR_PEP_ID=MMETSP0804-20121206/19430_1 /TAXON_ID=1074897 /ORGANISM="Tetraselmis astigmatica, Strain CCMP880" /LENGTH=56 /DNA_ID=CAMNT_0005492091 /DNA_START=275 /DNA_END=445 /DNA_ORIENTATION=+
MRTPSQENGGFMAHDDMILNAASFVDKLQVETLRWGTGVGEGGHRDAAGYQFSLAS